MEDDYASTYFVGLAAVIVIGGVGYYLVRAVH
jgi:hypothetical protein